MNMFVDDIKIMEAKNFGVISLVKEELIAIFEMVDMGLISFYFGLKVSQTAKKDDKTLLTCVYRQNPSQIPPIPS